MKKKTMNSREFHDLPSAGLSKNSRSCFQVQLGTIGDSKRHSLTPLGELWDTAEGEGQRDSRQGFSSGGLTLAAQHLHTTTVHNLLLFGIYLILRMF